MDNTLNPIKSCYEIFLRPNAVFAKLHKTHNWSWVAFILVILFSVLPIYAYISYVDFNWYIDFMVQSGGDLSPAEIDNMKALFSQETLVFSAIMATVFSQIIINLLIATYLHLSTKSDENNVNGFTDWYGFTWWILLPYVISCSVALLVIALADSNQLRIESLNPLCLAYWLGLDATSQWYTLTSLIKPDSFLTIYLTLVGLNQWTSFSTSKINTIVIAPIAAMFIAWVLFLLV